MMETVRRTFQLAHVMRAWQGTRSGPDPFDDTERVLRYLAKVTIEPAITHGIADDVGSLRPGRMADIVLWSPAWFGVKPAAVLKGGALAWSPLGEGNATVEGAEPTRYRPDWAGFGRAAAARSLTFVSSAAAGEPRIAATLAAHGRRLATVHGMRGLTRDALVHNRATAAVEVDVGDGAVSLGGRPLVMDPVREVPLSRRYLLR
jgi:urease subunit alpha